MIYTIHPTTTIWATPADALNILLEKMRTGQMPHHQKISTLLSNAPLAHKVLVENPALIEALRIHSLDLKNIAEKHGLENYLPENIGNANQL